MKIIKIIVFILLLCPLLVLVYWGFYDQLKLTAEPVEYILHYTGLWSLRILLLTLAMTPLRNITKQVVFLRLRRMIGLYATTGPWAIVGHSFLARSLELVRE